MRAGLSKSRSPPRSAESIFDFAVFESPAFRARVITRLGHEGRILIDRDVKLAHRKSLADRHGVLRALVVIAILLAARRAHGEASRRHDHHVGTLVAFVEHIPRPKRA